MSTILIALLSIWFITFCAYLAKKVIHFVPICPICVGVSSTWILLLIARQFDLFVVDIIVPAILMGGSVVGIAYQADRLLPNSNNSLTWKIFFIPFGFLFVYSFLVSSWSYLLLSLVLIFLTVAWFWNDKSGASSSSVKTLEDKMKNCCQ